MPKATFDFLFWFLQPRHRHCGIDGMTSGICSADSSKITVVLGAGPGGGEADANLVRLLVRSWRYLTLITAPSSRNALVMIGSSQKDEQDEEPIGLNGTLARQEMRREREREITVRFGAEDMNVGQVHPSRQHPPGGTWILGIEATSHRQGRSQTTWTCKAALPCTVYTILVLRAQVPSSLRSK